MQAAAAERILVQKLKENFLPDGWRLEVELRKKQRRAPVRLSTGASTTRTTLSTDHILRWHVRSYLLALLLSYLPVVSSAAEMEQPVATEETEVAATMLQPVAQGQGQQPMLQPVAQGQSKQPMLQPVPKRQEWNALNREEKKERVAHINHRFKDGWQQQEAKRLKAAAEVEQPVKAKPSKNAYATYMRQDTEVEEYPKESASKRSKISHQPLIVGAAAAYADGQLALSLAYIET